MRDALRTMLQAMNIKFLLILNEISKWNQELSLFKFYIYGVIN